MAHPIRTALSLFSGGGGLDLGVRIANPCVRVVGHVEFESHAASVLLARMEDQAMEPAPIWCGDIGAFDAGPYQDMVDLITGGPPCQPFSNAGKRKGADDARNGCPQFLRVVGDVRPPYVFAENVPSSDSLAYYYAEVLPRLSGMGYRVAEGIFSAAEVGATHLRERLFILGFNVAYAGHSTGSPELREQQEERAQGLGRGGAGDVADAEGSGRQATGERCGEHAGSEPEARRGTVGLSDCAVLPVPRSRRASTYERLPFPPGREDWDAWAAVLRERPDLAPALPQSEIRFLADGLAGRMGRTRNDILRVLGNGVVPLCAARAFVVLRRRLGL